MRQVGADEAKNHLPRLLDAVTGGESITITRRGRPVAILVPAPLRRTSAQVAAGSLLAFRRAHRLGGVAIRDLIDDGRQQ
jgi:prevent-host-death family protein